jgi:hypothetical protein
VEDQASTTSACGGPLSKDPLPKAAEQHAPQKQCSTGRMPGGDRSVMRPFTLHMCLFNAMKRVPVRQQAKSLRDHPRTVHCEPTTHHYQGSGQANRIKDTSSELVHKTQIGHSDNRG